MENCNICEANGLKKPAKYDCRIPLVGSWAYVCEDCFIEKGCSLGVGSGQILSNNN